MLPNKSERREGTFIMKLTAEFPEVGESATTWWCEIGHQRCMDSRYPHAVRIAEAPHPPTPSEWDLQSMPNETGCHQPRDAYSRAITGEVFPHALHTPSQYDLIQIHHLPSLIVLCPLGRGGGVTIRHYKVWFERLGGMFAAGCPLSKAPFTQESGAALKPCRIRHGPRAPLCKQLDNRAIAPADSDVPLFVPRRNYGSLISGFGINHRLLQHLPSVGRSHESSRFQGGIPEDGIWPIPCVVQLFYSDLFQDIGWFSPIILLKAPTYHQMRWKWVGCYFPIDLNKSLGTQDWNGREGFFFLFFFMRVIKEWVDQG